MNPIFGREEEKGMVLALLEQESLITLTGPGGIGKTTVARAIAQSFPEPWWFVSLATIGDVDHIIWAIAQELGLTDASQLERHVLLSLQETPGLLVLDNFEHLLPDGANKVTTLLAACPGLKILVTSREGLQLREEVIVEIPPLALPTSITLFQQQVFHVLPQFQFSPENMAVTTAICRRLEGIPLAIELAASRLQLFTLEELKARLDHRLRVLSGGPHDAPKRQRTLRNTLAWSYELLSPEEQWLFRCLSVFTGATVPAIETVCGLLGQDNPLDRLTSLLKKHLLLRRDTEGQSRLMMLETIREYALEKLEESGEESIIREAHATYVCQFVQEDQSPGHIDLEQENIRAALAWLFLHLSQPRRQGESLIRLYTVITRLGNYWEARGQNQEAFTTIMRFLTYVEQHHIQEDAYYECYVLASKFALVLGHMEQALSLAQIVSAQGKSPLRQAQAYLQMGNVEAQRHHFEQAEGYLTQSISIFRSVSAGEAKGHLAYALLLLGDVLADRGKEYDRPYQVLSESVRLFEEIGNTPLWGRARHHLSILYFYHGKRDEALLIGEQCLSEVVALGYPMPQAYLATWLAAFLLGEHHPSSINRAEMLLAESLQIFERLHNQHGVSWALIHRARLAVLNGQREQAQKDYMKSLGIATTIGDIFLLYHCLDGLAEVLLASSLAEAIALFSEAAAIRDVAGLTLPPVYQAYQERLFEAYPTMKAHPSWAMGRQAARKRLEAARFSVAPPKHMVLSQLTPREREVLTLVSQGLPNKEIAERLVVSSRTVEAHLRAIYEKLGIRSRSAATRIAISMRLD